MTETAQKAEPASATLCKSCGLCCTGHLFINAYVDPVEIERTRNLGLNVLQSNPDQLVFILPCPLIDLAHLFPLFTQPCPLWRGQCTVYTHPHRPSICCEFRCKLLEELEHEETSLDQALTFVRETKGLIHELEVQLPACQDVSFRERLFKYVNRLEEAVPPTEAGNAFCRKADVLLTMFSRRFGVTGSFNGPEPGKSDPWMNR